MTRITGFNSPFMLGFDHFEQLIDRVTKASGEGYPPYNIERLDDNRLRITVAVAGFSMDDLEVLEEDNQLAIRGRHNGDDGERVFLHRGIAARQFQRSFVLAEGIEIKGAVLDNGLLHIDLERKVHKPEVRSIKIVKGSVGAAQKTIDIAPDAPIRK